MYWASKMLAWYILSSMCLSKLSQLSFMQYMGLYVFSLHIYLIVIVGIYVFYLILSSSRKYELFSVVYGKVIKQWYALFVFL